MTMNAPRVRNPRPSWCMCGDVDITWNGSDHDDVSHVPVTG